MTVEEREELRSVGCEQHSDCSECLSETGCAYCSDEGFLGHHRCQSRLAFFGFRSNLSLVYELHIEFSLIF